MLDFAVHVEGVDEVGKGRWVLYVDPVGERFLVANADTAFGWVNMADCQLLKVRNPEAPIPVLPVQSQKMNIDFDPRQLRHNLR